MNPALDTRKILVLHGPNLNLLGVREPQHYGADTLAAINARLTEQGKPCGAEVTTFQSNREYELVERIQATLDDGTDFIIINPAAFTHTSVAIRDALAAVKKPLSKYTYPTCMPVKLSDAIRISPISRSV